MRFVENGEVKSRAVGKTRHGAGCAYGVDAADDKIMHGKRIDAFIADHGTADDSRFKLEKA